MKTLQNNENEENFPALKRLKHDLIAGRFLLFFAFVVFRLCQKKFYFLIIHTAEWFRSHNDQFLWRSPVEMNSILKPSFFAKFPLSIFIFPLGKKFLFKKKFIYFHCSSVKAKFVETRKGTT